MIKKGKQVENTGKNEKKKLDCRGIVKERNCFMKIYLITYETQPDICVAGDVTKFHG